MPLAISKASIERARTFVTMAARPLDAAYLEAVLPSAPSDAPYGRLIDELAKFQTAEGGFAHAIEPDVRTPAPTAISTSVAFQYLRGIDAPGDHPMVKAGIGYLVATVDPEAWVWPATDERVSEGPYAPWWTPDLPRFRGYALNPTAELLGYLYDYRDFAPELVLQEVTKKVLSAVEEIEFIGSAYELVCCMRLIHSKGLPSRERTFLEEHLSRSLEAANPEDGHLDLMRLVPTPTSFGYEIVEGGIRRQAERLISSQAEDGGWHPHWETWHDDAQKEWSGEITSKNIIKLSAHGFVGDC